MSIIGLLLFLEELNIKKLNWGRNLSRIEFQLGVWSNLLQFAKVFAWLKLYLGWFQLVFKKGWQFEAPGEDKLFGLLFYCCSFLYESLFLMHEFRHSDSNTRQGQRRGTISTSPCSSKTKRRGWRGRRTPSFAPKEAIQQGKNTFIIASCIYVYFFA